MANSTAHSSAYRSGMRVSRVNDDMLVATSDWLYMTLRRLKRDDEARCRRLNRSRQQMDVIENMAYHARLLMYKGQRTPESVLNLNTADDVQIATQGYGVGNWYLVNGDRARKRRRSSIVCCWPPCLDGLRIHCRRSGRGPWLLSRLRFGPQAIGSTPLLRLRTLVPPSCADVLVKLEFYNPTGSYKDRMALAMIEGAEARGALGRACASSSTPAAAPARRWRWSAR